MSLLRFPARLTSLAAVSFFAAACGSKSSDEVSTPPAISSNARYVLIGDVTPKSVRLNLTTRSAGLHPIGIAEEGKETRPRIVSVTTTDLEGATYARGNYDLIGLKPGTKYTVVGMDSILGSFETPVENPKVIRLFVGSCFNFRNDTVQIYPDFDKEENRTRIDNHQIWNVANSQDFDGAFFIGDRFYLPNFYEDYAGMTDTDFYRTIDEHHEGMMQIPGMMDFLTRMPIYVTWDDHDFGPNNSAQDFVFAGQALKHTAWSLPQPNMGTESTPGVFFKQSFGDVDTFTLDGRYYRECANRTFTNRRTDKPARGCGVEGIMDEATGIFHPDEMLQDCYGKEQLDWLKAELLASDAPVKLIIGGNQFLSNIHRFEAWYHYAEREEFLEWMNENPVPGVIFVSGDRHHGEVGVLDQDVPYNLYELTSSGMGTNCYPNDERDDPDPTLSPFDVIGGTSMNHFGVVEYHSKNQEVRLQLYTHEGELVVDQVIMADSLKP